MENYESNILILGLNDELPNDDYEGPNKCMGIDFNNPFDEYLVFKSKTSDKIIYKLINQPKVNFSYNSDSDLSESDSNSDDSSLEINSLSDEFDYLNFENNININLNNKEDQSEISEIFTNKDMLKLLKKNEDKIKFIINGTEFFIKNNELENYFKLFDLINNQNIKLMFEQEDYILSSKNEWSKKIE